MGPLSINDDSEKEYLENECHPFLPSRYLSLEPFNSICFTVTLCTLVDLTNNILFKKTCQDFQE